MLNKSHTSIKTLKSISMAEKIKKLGQKPHLTKDARDLLVTVSQIEKKEKEKTKHILIWTGT